RSASVAVQHSPRWTDLRLLPVTAMVWLTSWFGIRLNATLAVVSGLLMLGLASGVVLWHFGFAVRAAGIRISERRRPKVTAAVVLSLSLGGIAMLSGYGQAAQREADPLHRIAEQRMLLPVIVEFLESPRNSGVPGKVSVLGRVSQAGLLGQEVAGGLRVEISAGSEWSGFRRGDVVRTVGAFRLSEPGEAVTARMSVRGPAQRIAEPPLATAWQSELRERFSDASQSVWGEWLPDAAALLPGIVFGDRSRQSADLLDAMKTTGLTHLTAVSGTNCSIVLAGLLLFARSCRLPRFWSAGLAAVGLFGFVSLVGPDPSVLRAASMGSLGVLALLCGRAGQAGPLLCAAGTALLLIDPWLSGSFGFVLSVLATAGLIALGPPLRLWLGRWLPDWFAVLLSIPLAAQLAVAPVIVLLQPALASYAVPANLFAGPVVAWSTVLGMLGLLLLALAPWAAAGLIGLAGLGAAWIALVARFFQGIPGAALPWWEGWPGVLAMAALSGSILVLLAVFGGTPAFRQRLSAGAARLSEARLLPDVVLLRKGIVRFRRSLGWTLAAAGAMFLGGSAAALVLGSLIRLPP
ncbi:MAG: ComEC/Rec2 family competence protein, partial [Renibacterium salmoninarum]|nr:ComEC/Rec2 family competence protein [Renibacterium salmoninarum]